jgi:hypothetical protein
MASLVAAIVLCVAAVFAEPFASRGEKAPPPVQSDQSGPSAPGGQDESTSRRSERRFESFGKTLALVSLSAPTAAADIERVYGDWLSPALLEQWKADPLRALGRLVSSPCPTTSRF